MTNSVQHQPTEAETPVTLINAYSVPMTQGDLFLERWRANAGFMTGAPGMIRVRMYRATSERAEITFVNVAEWRSQAAFDAARQNAEWQAGVRAVLQDPELQVTTRPMVYHLVADLAA